MDPREQIGDFEEFLREYLHRHQSQMWTALPMVVNTWNYPGSGQNTVHAVPAVMGQSLQPNGTWLAKPMPECQDMPVHFLGGGGFYFTHPISQGDEGIGIFSARCIDGWWQNGGTQPRPAYGVRRMHDLSDGMFIPTRMSHKNVLPSISQTSAQLRSVDGTSYLEMLGAGGGFNFVTLNGAVRIDGSGNLTVTGEITAGTGGTDSVTLQQHTHKNAGGSGNSGTPNAGT